MLAKTRVVHFLVAGSSGFTLDALLLSLLVNGFGWSPYAARALSFSCAMALTWYLNRTLTFRDRSSPRIAPEVARYALVQAGGAVVNYGIFSALVAIFAQAARWPLIALVPAAAAAMVFTYLGMHYFAFRRRPLQPAHD